MLNHAQTRIVKGAAAAVLATALLWPLTGCDGADRTRELEQKLTQTRAQLDESRLELKQCQADKAQLRQAMATLNGLPPERWELIPRAETLSIGRYSGIRQGKAVLPLPTTQPAGPGAATGESGQSSHFLRLYLTAQDRRGYQLRVAGPIRISLFDLSGRQQDSLGVYEFTAEQAAEHYRSALASELWAFDLPLPRVPEQGVTVHVAMTDYLTGKTLIAQSRIKRR